MSTKPPIPEHMILHLKEDKQIRYAAIIEAEMSFLKATEPNELNTAIFIYPDLVRSKEDLFLFAMVFGQHLAELQHNLRQVSPQVKAIFDKKPELN